MRKIPAETLKQILELRAENGLEATEEAALADLTKSKAKWVLEETPRYRQAGRSPLFISGKYLTKAGTDPATGEADRPSVSKTAAKPASRGGFVGDGKALDETTFYKVLHGKGFAVKISKDLLTGELETHIPPVISKLGLKFGAIPANAIDLHVVQTTPQIQVAMPLDKFLELSAIRPG